MAETQVAPRFRGIVLPDALGRLTTLQWMAVIATAVTFTVYVATALRGVSFGDWAEMQVVPARLEVPHETGFPLYVLLTKAFTLLPIGLMAFRATLLSVTAAAGAIGLFVLIAGRLGVRPVIALAAGIALAGTATLWEEATFPEMNTLHLFLSALLVHRALVWRAERRDRDLRLGALFSGLALSNHLLALSVVPIVILFVLAEDRLRLLRRPRLVLELVLLLLAGLSFYLFIVVRALTGPTALYGDLRSVDGFLAFVTGAQFRIDMRFGTVESLAEAWRAVPDLVAGIQQRANVAFSLVPLAGAVILVLRDRWAGWLTIAIVAANVYLFVGYRGDLPHYLLVTWFVLALWLAVAVEAAIRWLRARVGSGFEDFEFGLVAVAAIFLVSNWAAHDQSGNRLGEEYTQAVLDRLPPNAVLVTYWDTLTALSYQHCIEGERPDIAVIAHDRPLTASCDLITEPLDVVARTRPIYALEVFERSLDRLRPSFDFIEVATIKVPYGDRFPEFTRPLYRLEPQGRIGTLTLDGPLVGSVAWSYPARVELPRIVGRERELATILGLAEEARRRGGPVATFVTGDPGQGKSRLVDEVANRVEPMARLRAQGFEPERNVPLAAAGEMLRRLAPLETSTAEFDPASSSRSVEPIRIFERAARSMSQLGPTLLTLDDVQWADELSVALCLYLLRAAASASQPLLLVVAGRDTPAIAALDEAVRHALDSDVVVSIALQPLDRDAGLTLLLDLAPDLSQADAVEVWRLAAGSPFWLHALSSGKDRGAQEVVATRLRGLTDDAVALLGAIAVVGRPVAVRELADLLGWPAERAAGAASGLTDRGLVVLRDGGLQVIHDLLRQAAAERLRPETQRELHEALSERLERTSSDNVAQLREALDHRRLGGLPALQLAARLLGSPRRRWLGRDGLSELAAIVDDEASGTPEWPELAAAVATLAVELNDHAVALERWRDIADRADEPGAKAAAALGAAKAAFELERGAVARDWIERARVLSAMSADPARDAALDAVDALVLIWLEHRLAEGEVVAERAAQSVRALIRDAGGPQRLSPEAWRATLDALRVRWDAFIQREDRIPDALTEELLAVTAHDEVAHLASVVLAGLAADPDTGLDIMEERFRLAWDEARRRLMPGIAVDAGFWLAVTLFDMGRLAEAQAVLVEVQALVARAGDHGKIRARSRSLPDELRIVRGEWETAAPSLLAAAMGASDAHRQIPYLQVLTRWAARVRPATAVREYLDAGVEAAAAGGCPRCAADFHLAAAQAAARIDDGPLARQLLTAWAAERRSPNSWGVAQRRWTEALITRGERDGTDVAAELDAVAMEADRLRMRLEATVIRLDYARVLATVDRGRSAEVFREVARVAASLGAVVVERSAERELRGLGVRTWRRGPSGGTTGELTARELEIAELVARGDTNPEIAERLFLSRKTVERHVSNILGKVGVRNRAELSGIFAARDRAERQPDIPRNEGAPR